MHDKVLGIIRETLLHENEVDQLSFDFRQGNAVLHMRQPRADYGYPDHDLELHFTGIREFQILPATADLSCGGCLLGVECLRKEDSYHAVVAVGSAGRPATWTLHLAFTDLSYKRYANDNAA